MLNKLMAQHITGNKITASTDTYTISLFFDKVGSTPLLMSEYRWYKVDREDEKLPYNFVRFHWLNRMGGIDSYTAKRDVIRKHICKQRYYRNKKCR